MKNSILWSAILLSLFTGCRNRETPINHLDVERASRLIGISFPQNKIDTLLPYLQRNLEGYDSMRQYSLDREILPALLFNPLPKDFEYPQGEDELTITEPKGLQIPGQLDSLCFYPVWQLGYFIRTKKISSIELTRLYLNRIKRYDKTLKSFITLTEDLALEQAKKADDDLANGIYHGPLHGIPYGLKDLISVQGYPTTWGSVPYQKQEIDYSAPVANRLKNAGAVLLGKLSSGALARGDVWFGGQTVSPWDTLMGASGSSAGSGSATAAGLVAFSIGTETLGSIIMPSSRNGITGFRPSYGTVSRYGVMALSWSMDKIGPICRDAQDCAMVYKAIHGHDPLDPTTMQLPLVFDANRELGDFRIGVLQRAIEEDTTTGAENLRVLIEDLNTLGLEMIAKEFSNEMPYSVFDIILRAESGAFFDELIRSSEIDNMVQQDKRSRANSLRQSRYIPAVEYLQANRFRTILINEINDLFSDIDVLISPVKAKNQLLISNLCGIPSISIPTGLDSLGHPTSLTVLSKLYSDGKLLEFSHALEKVTKFKERIPDGFLN